MENKLSKLTPAKAAFAKLNNRPGSLAVSSNSTTTLAFRFNPADEETLVELQEPAAPTTKKIVKRRSADDVASSTPVDSCPETQTWSFLSDIKGKITKKMEEKFHIDLHGGGSPASAVTNAQQRKSSDLQDKSLDCKFTTKSTEVDDKPSETLPSLFDSDDGVKQRRPPRRPKSTPVVESSTPLKVDEEINEPRKEHNFETAARSQSMWCLPFAWNQKYGKLAVAVFLCLMCALLPLPAYWSGFVSGCLFIAGFVFMWLILIGFPNRTIVIDRTAAATALLMSGVTRKTSRTLDGQKKVWMNELLSDYSPEDFHMNQTQSVFVRLEGSVLRLSYPKAKIPKRAMWNENRPFDETFIHQRHYELQGATVKLLPEKLARRRHWIRKYPIYIRLAEDSKVVDVAPPVQLLKTNAGSLTFFTRIGREKEEWYRLLDAASKLSNNTRSRQTSGSDQQDNCAADKEYQEYWVHVSRLISTPIVDRPETLDGASSGVTWLNALLGRGLWDFMRDREGALLVKTIMQQKLSMIKVPYFIEDLRITDLELGSELPQLSTVSSPTLNDKGIWVDFDMSYFGAFRMTLETKLNLLKFKRHTDLENEMDALNTTELQAQKQPTPIGRMSSMYDSDAYDSAESSSDDESIVDHSNLEIGSEETPGTGGTSTVSPSGTTPVSGRHCSEATSKKLLRFVDTIAQSRYFQHATEYKYVKKAMEGVSNTRLILTVEVLTLSGKLTINLPPPPSDRLWYGFRGNPQLIVIAKPKVGEREVNLTNIVEWIESKMVLEFQRMLVLPNMDDLIIPFMNSGMVNTPGSSKDVTPATPPFGFNAK